jgi:hypothetical protein
MDMDHRMGAATPWGWIAGAVLIIVVLALIYSSGEVIRTAGDHANPPATTGMAPKSAPRTAPPAITVAPRPETPSTSGQGKQ